MEEVDEFGRTVEEGQSALDNFDQDDIEEDFEE